jgi:hypothetical protein
MSQIPQRLLPVSAAITAVAVAAALLLPGGDPTPPALWHLVFAVGALPMILAAMTYFVPVLTRSGTAPRLLALAPLAALLAGLGIFDFFHRGTPVLRLASPWLALAAVAGFAAWLGLRWRACLGHPNPCLRWYAAALGCIAAGLAAVAASAAWPQHAHALRLFHLHINTLGFMGITALGTLQVLLPTVAGRPDPEAAVRLARDLKWSLGGALLIAFGAATVPALALAGALAYAWPPLRLIGHAWREWRREVVAAGSVMPLLVAATAGLVATLAHGAMHANGIAEGRAALPLFVIAFLLPLVSGAAGQLLPIWLRPGVQGDWHGHSRQRLALGARLRGVLLLAGGMAAALGNPAAYALGAFAALWLVLAMLAVVASRRN